MRLLFVSLPLVLCAQWMSMAASQTPDLTPLVKGLVAILPGPAALVCSALGEAEFAKALADFISISSLYVKAGDVSKGSFGVFPVADVNGTFCWGASDGCSSKSVTDYSPMSLIMIGGVQAIGKNVLIGAITSFFDDSMAEMVAGIPANNPLAATALKQAKVDGTQTDFTQRQLRLMACGQEIEQAMASDAAFVTALQGLSKTCVTGKDLNICFGYNLKDQSGASNMYQTPWPFEFVATPPPTLSSGARTSWGLLSMVAGLAALGFF